MLNFRLHVRWHVCGQRLMLLFGVLILSSGHFSFGQKRVLSDRMYHLRNGDTPEWTEFSVQPEGKELTLKFVGKKNKRPKTLQIRQKDVRQQWHVLLNGVKLANLVQDEKEMVIYLEVPVNGLARGENILSVVQIGSVHDDIMVGEIVLHDLALDRVLSEAIVSVEVLDAKSNSLLPSRLTITNDKRVLQTVQGYGDQPAAIRPGYVYHQGRASFSLPEGTYTLYAGRGFEYGVDSIQLKVKRGDQIHHRFKIDREVSTPGWISSDTHIHTFAHSGHGDATVEERLLTIAGEGIELPIITEHNLQIDIREPARTMELDTHFTLVIGNEVTTSVGHFNIFPVSPEAPVAKSSGKDWNAISEDIQTLLKEGGVILNHGRDLHRGFRPLGEERHISIAGWNSEGWKLPANGMEVINSGALKTQVMQLYNDWFGMLNRGYSLTPVGSSDAHDVSRFHLGQARTYIRSLSEDAGNIDVEEVVENFRQGKVMVSFGLLTELEINDRYGPGDVVPPSGELKVSVRVQGPAWVNASYVALYANGIKIREETIRQNSASVGGAKWVGEWILPKPEHDLFLVAVAEGPGIAAPFWPIPKPYQADSPEWIPSVIGSSGAAWIDADNDGAGTSAYTYANRLLEAAKHDIHLLFGMLRSYDEAVAVQMAALLDERGILSELDLERALHDATPATKSGFTKYINAVQLKR